jgi:hypothetical protein
MIYINHELKSIFIHIPKTGGSYIGPTLVKYYGFKSYLNIIRTRRPDHKEICGENNIKTFDSKYDYSFFNKTIGILNYCKTSEFLNKNMDMTPEKWITYKKFCFIRNPYDRILSGWEHIRQVFNYNMTLQEYLIKKNINVSDIEYGHIYFSQKRQIEDINGTCGVDIIGRFEYLEQDFIKILNEIGITHIKHVTIKVNVSRPYKTNIIILNINTIQLINRIFKDDFDVFHYKKIL